MRYEIYLFKKLVAPRAIITLAECRKLSSCPLLKRGRQLDKVKQKVYWVFRHAVSKSGLSLLLPKVLATILSKLMIVFLFAFFYVTSFYAVRFSRIYTLEKHMKEDISCSLNAMKQGPTSGC